MKTIFFLLFFIPLICFSQKQERQVLGYNIAFGAITSGIGAVINKPKHTNWKRYLLKGAWQGSIGGLLNYSGKKTLYFINKNNEPGYGWPAKILHAAGSSIIENAALNEPFLQNWNVDVGIVRLDFSLNASQSFRARFLPVSVYAILNGSRRGKMDWNASFRTGTITYYSKGLISNGNSFDAAGLSYGRGIVYTDIDGYTNKVLAHELIHTFQYRDYMVFNTYFKPLEKKIKNKFINKLFSRYVYADIPYLNPFYLLEGKRDWHDHYFRNFFEFEAERFATNKYVYK